ncbi:hypothetical protein CDL15_Pgr003597 [Punica granatum]|uniref:RIC1 C-terminal alpha solenoid region domain-containing protein n=2 Tax=Punica granatum TaxID=22663 RepID=A0A218XSN3_PUNGR|nr:hypothetical protein CDL15_Pgr003597 [Punica granatum]
MYMAYGWPQVIPLEQGLCPSSQHIVYLRVINRLSLVVSPSHLELWSSSQAVWSPDAKLIAVLTSSLFLHIFKVQYSDKRVLIGGRQPSGLFFANLSLVLNEQVPFAEMNLAVSNIVCDSKHMLLGLSDGSLFCISWKGEFYGPFALESIGNGSNQASDLPQPLSNGVSTEWKHGTPEHNSTTKSAIVHLELYLSMRSLFVLYDDGQLMSCSVSKKGLKQADLIKPERIVGSGDAVCASVASEQQILAVGTAKGVVELYDLAESASLIRTVSLHDWGYSMEDTGPVSSIAWTPDNSAFAVGWKFRGLTVWSVSGCRLMSTIRQIGLSSISSPMGKQNQGSKFEPLMGGVSLMQWDEFGYRLYAIEEQWDEFGYRLYAIEERSLERILVFSFGKCCLNRGVSGMTYVRQVIYGEDRLLVVQSEDTNELKMLHLNLPVSYISQNWPVQHVAASKDGMYLAVAGLHGLILYDIRFKKWRVFGDLSTVRELSIMTAKSHPAAMRFIPDQLPRVVISNNHLASSDFVAREPARCLILRVNGELSLLDLDDGRERDLTDSVELFWVTCGQSVEKTNLIEEVSWLDYGHRGMQVWYPSPGADPFMQEDFLQLDPELEFDREVYPLGLLPNAGVVVGVSQRMRSLILAVKQPDFKTEQVSYVGIYLVSLLDDYIERDKIEEALRLARLSAEKPHFSHCLEWLLFTVFDAEISRHNINKNQTSGHRNTVKLSLLEKTCDLIRNFPEYFDVVVSVARKTDGRHWADLFSAAGRSTELFEECFQRRWYRTAACYILVIAKLEGPAVSQYCALRLLQATLDESLYELAGELVRFLLRSGREYEQTSSDSEKLSPRFLGYFLFRSSYRKQPTDYRSPSFTEQSAHVASVKNILESHASYLMSGKELSKLVAFVKGTQFDLVDYLQRERHGSARLESFASGLELIGQKAGTRFILLLQMATLQSRLDAEFLLAHMCSVKFKEWIVVLATLLRRSEVLFDIFRHDLRLWKAYSVTLQSHPAFVEYQDLVEALEERLSSLSNSEEK